MIIWPLLMALSACFIARLRVLFESLVSAGSKNTVRDISKIPLFDIGVLGEDV
jgi:hypothetical protein